MNFFVVKKIVMLASTMIVLIGPAVTLAPQRPLCSVTCRETFHRQPAAATRLGCRVTSRLHHNPIGLSAQQCQRVRVVDALHAGGATTVSSTGSSTKAWRTPRKMMAANSHRNTRPVSNGAQTSGCQQCRTQTKEHEVTKWISAYQHSERSGEGAVEDG